MCKPIEFEIEEFLMELKKEKCKEINLFVNNFENNKKLIKMCILSNLMEHIKTENSFALYDEDIFDIYKSIIENYKIFLIKYNEIKENINENMQKNINGLISVLNSQISFFEEKDNLGINPITTEKKQIIANYLDNIYADIENISKNFEEEILGKEYTENFEDIKELFGDFLKRNILNSYEKNIKNCFNSINYIENRKIAKYYNDILEEEKEILETIIKVQVKALEDLCENDEEIDFIGNILKPIKEIYQFSTKRFNQYMDNIKGINHNFQIDLKNDFKNIGLEIEKILNINKDYIEKNYNFKLQSIVLNYFEFKKKDNITNFKNYLKNANQTKNMFENIQNIFIEINKFIQNNWQKYLKTEFKEIINGIFESLNIKIQNLEENKQLFNNVYLEFKNKLVELENLKLNFDKYNLHCFFNIETLKDDIKNNIENENFKFYISAMEDFENELYNFKKDILLFEICTFQEIINYSVFKLRNAENEDIIKFVFYIDEATNNIEKILEFNNIFPINPKPHTIFNAKEHEILVAEKNEQFKKGEIIKVLNCGYKYLEKVLVRANVIAAK